MKKQDFIDMAKETLEIVNLGRYAVNGKFISLPIPEKGKLIKEINNKEREIEYFTNYTIVEERTLDAVHRFHSSGDVGVLNFASARNPGGGFLWGYRTQEESLAYSSDLYDTLVGSEYYRINRNQNSNMYTDVMIVSRVVNFFRDGDYNLIEHPSKALVLTSPAVNMGKVIKYGEDVLEANIVMKNRIRKIIQCFIEEGTKVLVLGAFGCGAFENESDIVAKYFYEILVEEGYGKSFTDIVFSIYGRTNTNINAFRMAFKDVI